MAATLAADRLTQAYRVDAAALRAAAVRDVLAVWPMLDPRDIDRSWQALRVALQAIVDSKRVTAARLAADYLRQFRELEGVAGDLSVLLADTPDLAALEVSLRATGPATVQRALSAGLTPALAAARALVTVSGAVSRVVLDGGRQTVLLTVEADRRALGWMRVTHGKTCAFCAMLASRGPVYKTRKSGISTGDPRGKPARFHDHCDCTVEPVYSPDTAWPAASVHADKLWAQSTRGVSGKDAINAFRVAYEATL